MLDIPEIAVLRPPPHRMERVLLDEHRPSWSWERAVEQHAAFATCLKSLGLTIIEMKPLERCPQSAFVGDVASIALDRALFSRFYDPKRRGEEIDLEEAIGKICAIGHAESPAKLFAGDVIFSDFAIWIGLSQRTNEQGAAQVAEFFAGYDVQTVPSEIPLRSRATYLEGGRFLARADTDDLPFLEDYEVLEVPPEEGVAAEAIVLGRRLLIPAGCPETVSLLESHDFEVRSVDVIDLFASGRGLAALCALTG